jgi:hypothetical protein
MRYICHTFFSLIQIAPDNICQDEFLEAKRAVETYVFHWEKKFTLLLDEKKKSNLSSSTRRSSTNSRQFASHRLSGMITQANFKSLQRFNLGGLQEQDEKGNGSSNALPEISISLEFPLTLSDPSKTEHFVIIDEVDGETVEDVTGILITGMRLILLSHEGKMDRVGKSY